MASQLHAQDIEIYKQFNGRFDYTAIGNTLNPFENNIVRDFCFPLESSAATLNLPPNATITAAYLYWAGSGNGDTSITLNELPVEADETYTVDYDEGLSILTYFSCFADITELIVSEGNTLYEFSDLDITDDLVDFPRFCGSRTNFAGWSIYIIYEDDNLPLNQINLYQGLEIINRNNQTKTIVIDNLNVVDNEGAKIGFLAWEGDNNLNFGESLSINGNVLSNPPLNLSDNAFNGTNTFTNSDTYYNCDLDVYDIQDNIAIGDTSATITMTTGGLDENGLFMADLIIINNIITVLNSQLPDATINLADIIINCGDDSFDFNYTVFNTNSTAVLPANTPIAFYIDGDLVAQSLTTIDIAINTSESRFISIDLPDDINETFTLTAIVDDNGDGNGIVTEILETNNTDEANLQLLLAAPLQNLAAALTCNEGFGLGTFNLENTFYQQVNTTMEVRFYESLEDLEAAQFEISNPTEYRSQTNPQTVFARIETPPCYEPFAFELMVENCPPRIPDGFSPNDDGANDWFNIQGLYDIFEQHELKIYNRYGTIIFEGDNDNRWEGIINRGLNNHGNLVPVGTYFYLLNLNDADYKPLFGWVYVNY